MRTGAQEDRRNTGGQEEDNNDATDSFYLFLDFIFFWNGTHPNENHSYPN